MSMSEAVILSNVAVMYLVWFLWRYKNGTTAWWMLLNPAGVEARRGRTSLSSGVYLKHEVEVQKSATWTLFIGDWVTEWWWGCCEISSWWDAPPRRGGCPVWSGRTPRPQRPCAGQSAATPTSCAAWGSLWRRSPPTVLSPCQSSLSCNMMNDRMMISVVFFNVWVFIFKLSIFWSKNLHSVMCSLMFFFFFYQISHPITPTLIFKIP